MTDCTETDDQKSGTKKEKVGKKTLWLKNEFLFENDSWEWIVDNGLSKRKRHRER